MEWVGALRFAFMVLKIAYAPHNNTSRPRMDSNTHSHVKPSPKEPPPRPLRASAPPATSPEDLRVDLVNLPTPRDCMRCRRRGSSTALLLSSTSVRSNALDISLRQLLYCFPDSELDRRQTRQITQDATLKGCLKLKTACSAVLVACDRASDYWAHGKKND